VVKLEQPDTKVSKIIVTVEVDSTKEDATWDKNPDLNLWRRNVISDAMRQLNIQLVKCAPVITDAQAALMAKAKADQAAAVAAAVLVDAVP
jgi:hypothetical protein